MKAIPSDNDLDDFIQKVKNLKAIPSNNDLDDFIQKIKNLKAIPSDNDLVKANVPVFNGDFFFSLPWKLLKRF